MKNWMCRRQMVAGLFCLLGQSCGPDLSIEQTSELAVDMSMSSTKDMSVDAGVGPDLMPPPPAPIPIQVTLRNCMLKERPSINTDKKPFGRMAPNSFPITVIMDERCPPTAVKRAISAYEGYVDCELTPETLTEAGKYSNFSLRIFENSRLHNFVSETMVSSRGEVYFSIPNSTVRHFVADDGEVAQPVVRINERDINVSLSELTSSNIRFHFRFSCYAAFPWDSAINKSTDWQIQNLLLVPIQ